MLVDICKECGEPIRGDAAIVAFIGRRVGWSHIMGDLWTHDHPATPVGTDPREVTA